MHNKPAQSLSFHVIDIAGSVLLSYSDTLALGFVLASEKLGKKLPIGTKNTISQA